MAVRQVEVAVEYDENPEDALAVLAEIITVIGLDIEVDDAEFATGTSDDGWPVITVLLTPNDRDEEVINDDGQR